MQTITIPATVEYGYIVPKQFILPKYLNKNSIITINISNPNPKLKNKKYFDDTKNPITWQGEAKDFLQKLSK